jgi:hypothetical protein
MRDRRTFSLKHCLLQEPSSTFYTDAEASISLGSLEVKIRACTDFYQCETPKQSRRPTRPRVTTAYCERGADSTEAIGVEHPEMLRSMSNLALVLDQQGKYEKAEEMHRRALEASLVVSLAVADGRRAGLGAPV